MGLIARETGTTNIEPVEEGVHLGRCYAVIDLGTHHDLLYNKDSRHVLLMWELPECRYEFEIDGKKEEKPRVLSRRYYSLSLGEKSKLRKDLESWRGRKFTPEELKAFDLKNLIGAGCQIQVIHETKDGRTYSKIAAIMSLPKGTKLPNRTENDPVFFSFDDQKPGDPLPKMPEWVVQIIEKAREYVGTPYDKDDDIQF